MRTRARKTKSNICELRLNLSAVCSLSLPACVCVYSGMCVYEWWVNLEIVIARCARFTYARLCVLLFSYCFVLSWLPLLTWQLQRRTHWTYDGMPPHTHTHAHTHTRIYDFMKPYILTNIHFMCTLMRTLARNMYWLNVFYSRHIWIWMTRRPKKRRWTSQSTRRHINTAYYTHQTILCACKYHKNRRSYSGLIVERGNYDVIRKWLEWKIMILFWSCGVVEDSNSRSFRVDSQFSSVTVDGVILCLAIKWTNSLLEMESTFH